MKHLITLIFFILYSVDIIAEETSQNVPLGNVAVDHASNFLQMMIGLLAIIAMIFAVVWLIKRTGYAQYQVSNAIKVKSCLSLSSKEKLVLIEVNQQHLLVGVAPGFVGHIKTINQPLAEDEECSSPSFSAKLKGIMSKGEMVE